MSLTTFKTIVDQAQPFADPAVVCLADVEPEEVEWLCEPYIPVGKVTLVEGDPGLGKSYATLAIAAALTQGEELPLLGMKGEQPKNVLLLSAEDGIADTIVPRFLGLGGDLKNAFSVERPLTFQSEDGFNELEGYIRQYMPTLVIIDPLFAYTGSKVDVYRPNEARTIMTGLAHLAERHRCAIVCIRHLTKSNNSKATYRGIGSIDFTAACRSALLVGQHPEDPSQAVIAHSKYNLSAKGVSICFEIRKGDGKFFWRGYSDLTADQILSTENDSRGLEIDTAKEFLQEILSDGPVLQSEIMGEAKPQGIAEKTLRRAKKQLGVKSTKKGFTDSKWRWELPPDATQDIQDTHIQDGGHLRENEEDNYKINKHLDEDGHISSDDDHLPDVATFEDGQDGQVSHLRIGGHLREGSANQEITTDRDSPLDVLGWPDELQQEFEERAAIMQYDGGLSREDAEREAEASLRTQMRASRL